MKKETKWKVDAKTNKKGRIHVSEIYRWGTVWRFLRNPPARALFPATLSPLQRPRSFAI